MKHVYTFAILSALVFLSGCSKDALKKYDDRIIGTWRISAVNRAGIGSNPDDVLFQKGSFQFQEGGALTYTDPSGQVFRGNWDIRKKLREDQQQRTLRISVSGPGAGEVLSESYDDVIFVGTDHFRANLVIGFQTYVTHFRR